jgi:hypothetical protein
MASKKPIEGRCGSLITKWKFKYGHKMYCELPPSKHKKRCKFHGGKALQGMDSPSFKTGLHTKTWPDAYYGSTFEEIFADDQLKQVRGDIATIELRISELRVMIKSPVGMGVVQLMEQAQHKLATSRKEKDIDESLSVLNNCTDLIRQNAALWEEMAQYIERKDKIIHNEHKRLMDTYETMSVAQLLVLARQIVTILKEEIKDKALGRRINERVRGLLPQQGSELVQ